MVDLTPFKVLAQQMLSIVHILYHPKCDDKRSNLNALYEAAYWFGSNTFKQFY